MKIPSLATPKSKIVFLAVLATAAVANTMAATVTVTGGGTNGQAIYVTLNEDFAIAAKPGHDFGGFGLGFRLNGALDQGQSTALNHIPVWNDLPNTGTVVYSDRFIPSINLTRLIIFSDFQTSLSNLIVEFADYTGYEFSFNPVNDATLTFHAGTITLQPSIGNLVLQNPGATYEITEADLWSRGYGNFPDISTNNAMIVPEPSALIMSAAGLIGFAFRRNRR